MSPSCVVVQERMEKLKMMRSKVNWEIENERYGLIEDLCPLINKWTNGSTLPKLWTIFWPKQIECLLMDCFNLTRGDQNYESVEKVFIKFVARTGYKDKPKVGKNGKIWLRRTTPIHLAARLDYYDIIPDLFKIYNRFDVNYSDDDGYTHFHAACQSGHHKVVKRFLELGQDPNFSAEKSRASPPLHLALRYQHEDVVESLLRSGADPNLANENLWTPLHVICVEYHDVAKVFFEMCEEKRLPLRVDARNKSGDTPLHLAARWEHKDLVRLLLERGANPNIPNKNKTTALHSICAIYDRSRDDSHFHLVELSCKKIRPGQINARNKLGYTPLHLALANFSCDKKIVRLLLEKGANPNSANLKGVTALHIVCEKELDGRYWLEMLFELSQAKYRPLQLDVQDESGDTPLHLALRNEHGTEMAETLLRRGANPNLADNAGQTSLHVICKSDDDCDTMQMIFELTIQTYPVQVNAQDAWGNTPLHLAMLYRHRGVTELLLRSGAEPNLADSKGSTPLHFFCVKKKDEDDLLKTFFEISDEVNRPMRIDARDKEGNTPLHLAVRANLKNVTESLLRRGADPNAVNLNGLSALHLSCQRRDQGELLKKFFAVNHERQQTVRINAKDNWGRTPLRLAVANVLPETVDVLLDNGANLSNFVFPTDLAMKLPLWPHKNWHGLILRQASGALIIVEHLEKRGYELDLSEALIVMSMFARYDMFEKSNFQKSRLGIETFTEDAEEVMIKPDLSLYKLIQLRPDEAAKQLNYSDYLEFSKSFDWQGFIWYKEDCIKHLCEKLSRRFFLDWALECFVILIHNRLPMPCCKMIIDELTNEDLRNICLATASKR